MWPQIEIYALVRSLLIVALVSTERKRISGRELDWGKFLFNSLL